MAVDVRHRETIERRCGECGEKVTFRVVKPVGDDAYGDWWIECGRCEDRQRVRGCIVGALSARIAAEGVGRERRPAPRRARKREVEYNVGGRRAVREVAPVVEVADPLGVAGSDWISYGGAVGRLREVTSVWDGWLPEGCLTLLLGNSDVGKSNLMLALVGVIITGGRWPDGTANGHVADRVLFLDTEAALAMHVGRAKRWGLPLEKIGILPLRDITSGFRLDREDHLAVTETLYAREDVGALFIDSLSGGHDWDENSAVMRRLLIRMSEMAARVNKPLLMSHHFRKPLQFEGSEATLDKARGSNTITQIARVVWAIDQPDEYRPETRRVLQLKNNFQEKPQPFGFEITDEGVVWVPAPERPKTTAEMEKALGFLKSALRPGPMLTTELVERAVRAGVSGRTLRRALRRLGCVSVRREGHWWRSLPGRQEALKGL